MAPNSFVFRSLKWYVNCLHLFGFVYEALELVPIRNLTNVEISNADIA